MRGTGLVAAPSSLVATRDTPDSPLLKLAPATQSVSVELTYRDGCVSEIKSFRR